MGIEARVRGNSWAPQAESSHDRVLGAGSSVVLLRPRRLRGTIGVVRRRTTSGWEVEIRTAQGTPMHLTLPERALHMR